MNSKPNIIFIMADQLAAKSVGCYGSGVDSTPTLDKLAAEGVRFERAYAHFPVCAPNRASILTGRSVSVHGITTNNLVLTNDNPTYIQVLKMNSYRTAGFGKFHHTPMQQPLPEDFSYLGFDESVPTEDTKLGPWLDWIEKEYPEYYERALAMCWPMQYLKEYGKEKRNLMPAWEKAYKNILQPIQQNSEWQAMYTSPLPAKLHQTTYVTDLALDFMKRHLESHQDTPFFCNISYIDPHDPYDPPVPYDSMFKPEDMPDPIPNMWKERGCKLLEHTQDWLNCRMLDGNEKLVKKLRALYHGSIRFIDDQINRIVDFVSREGLWQNTILIFTTDHGDMMGDQGLMFKGEMHYDGSARCPLIIYGGNIKRDFISERLTSSLDLFPTFCDIAGAIIIPPVEGKSFAEHIFLNPQNDKNSSEWEAVTIQSNSARSIITDDGWRITVFDEDGKGELFDLKADPQELKNLYYDINWITKRCELMEKMSRAYMKSNKVQQYRNLPLIHNNKCIVGNGFDLYPTFTS